MNKPIATPGWPCGPVFRRSFFKFLVFLFVAASTSPVHAQRPSAPVFVAELVDGDPVSGKLVGIEQPWRISLQGLSRLDGKDLASLQRKDQSPVVRPSGSQVLLANGDRIRAIAQHATQEILQVNSELLGDLEIPLERVLGFLLNPPSDATSRESLCRHLSLGERKQDVVLLANGDELSGAFLGLTDAVVKLEGKQGAIEVNRTEVRAVAFSSELISVPKPTQLYAKVILADGSEIAVLDGWTDTSSFRGRAAFDRELSVPLEQVFSIEFRNGRLSYLSDFEPAQYRHTPYLSTYYPFQRDLSVMGNSLSLRGRPFRKGLGVHSRSELTYLLDGHFRRFEAVVGIDDETAGQGSVQFRVLLDDKQSWESPPLTGRSAPLPVRIDLTSVRRLALIVDFADQGDVQDHADWADARLVR